MSKLYNFINDLGNNLKEQYNYNIYIDDIPQGFVEPSFFIDVVNSRRILVNSARYKYILIIALYYFPSKNEGTRELTHMAENLYEILNIIKGTERNYRAFNMSHKIIDNVLNITFSVNMHLCVKENNPYMEKLKYKGDLKNGNK